jgi:hypothetical protein
MAEYNLQDPYDLALMAGLFDRNNEKDWQEYIDLAEEKEMGYKNINILKTAQRKAGLSKFLSPKVIKWVLSLVDQLDEEM